ncbi:MAG: protein translocase subunit SecF, partial [Clostridia bacterium]|nr:protein translocase subunit SecF [Clostridia bacterium]
MRDFYGKRIIYFIISAALILTGIIGLFINGVKLDITFSGGAKITYSYTGEEIDAAEVEAIVKKTLNREASVQNSIGYQNDDTALIISLAGTESMETEEQEKLFNALNKKYAGQQLEQGSTTNVEPAIGHRFFVRGLIAIGLAAIFIIFYVSLRFSIVSGFTAALTALVALIHDIALIFFVYVLFGLPINDGFIAVVLTILGYSIN